MRIVVQGLWHLGSVTAACCARHFRVTGLDFDSAAIAGLRAGKAPLFEPGLDELLQGGIASGRLDFSEDPAAVCSRADVLWIAYDTPVDADDMSDTSAVLTRIRATVPHLRDGALVLVSSQLPVGTCAKLEAEFPNVHIAYSPENLRLGRAIDAFDQAERVIVGIRHDADHPRLEQLFAPFTRQVIFMRTESAEMVKHAINSFLGLSIAFINEVARLCEHVGADAREVSLGLKSEPRIGPRAYLNAGGPFAGGTLARDVVTLTGLAEQFGLELPLVPAIKRSNDAHRLWALHRLQTRFGDLSGRKFGLLGLVYKPGTSTLRRSAAVELATTLVALRAEVRTWDPAVSTLPPELSGISLHPTVLGALEGVDAAVICTEWPHLRDVSWSEGLANMRTHVVIDANRFLEKQLVALPGVEFISVGRH